MKSKLLLVLGGLLLIAVIIFLDIAAQEFLLKNNILSVSVMSVNETTDLYNIKAEYPQFNGISPEFNKKISSLMEEKIATFKKDSLDNWEARKATATLEFPVPDKPEELFVYQANWTPAQINNKYISVVLNIYFFSGGAHGSEEIYTFNYDVVNKEEITIEKLLGSQESLEKISDMAKAYIIAFQKSQGIEMDEFLTQMVNEGAGPAYSNYQYFTFNANNIVFYFQRYQVAPGSAGSFTFPVDKGILKEIGGNLSL